MTPTGDCGLIEKVFVMDCFGNLLHSLSVDSKSGDTALENNPTITGVRLPNLMIMSATSAANFCVSSK